MKNLLLTLVMLLMFFGSQAQVRNVNPDPNGDPWIVGALRKLTAADYRMLDALPRWKPENPNAYKSLPTRVDNSTLEWFRPIFNQSGGSCGQASGVGYNFTYEMDYERQIPANTPQNQYPSHFTWDFLNGGNGGGSWYFDGWMIIREAGCPTVYDYGGMAYGGDTRWMTGYDLYYNAMFNRTLDFYAIDVSTYEGLETVKQWLFSRDGGTQPGGLVNFGAGIGESTMSYLPSGTPHAGDAVITQWGTSADHAMTFVGYDDEICYDFNNDGQYTTDLDINGDGVVDLRDCEVGGMIMANSWGTGFGFGGKAYVMYKLLADPIEVGGIWSNTVHIVRAKPDAEPMLTYKATIKHTSRNKIKIMAGIATDPNAEKPEYCKSFPMFNYQGGDHFMQGGYSNADKTIEIGLDVTDLLSYVEPGQDVRYFLQVCEQDPYNAGDGEVVDFSVIDYTGGTAVETVSDMQNVPIANNDTTLVWANTSVDFDKVNIVTENLATGGAAEPYSFQLEADNGTPPYTWSFMIDYNEDQIGESFPAITDNQLQPTNDDDGYATLPLDFDFPFYGQPYNELTVLTDGAITFDGIFSYIRDDPAVMGNKCIAAYCSDLMIYPNQGDGIYYEGDETHMTIRWITSKFDQPDFDVDVAVTLYPDGNIRFFYNNDISASTDWSSGISTGDGNNYEITSVAGMVNIPDDFAASFASAPFPAGMSISEDGIFQGTPTTASVWEIPFKVTDYNRISRIKTLTFETLWTGMGNQTTAEDATVQVSPNPFEGFLDISFRESGKYRVELYDMTGRRIATLFNGATNARDHFRWTAGNLQNGTYLLHWDNGTHSGTRKLVLTR